MCAPPPFPESPLPSSDSLTVAERKLGGPDSPSVGSAPLPGRRWLQQRRCCPSGAVHVLDSIRNEQRRHRSDSVGIGSDEVPGRGRWSEKPLGRTLSLKQAVLRHLLSSENRVAGNGTRIQIWDCETPAAQLCSSCNESHGQCKGTRMCANKVNGNMQFLFPNGGVGQIRRWLMSVLANSMRLAAFLAPLPGGPRTWTCACSPWATRPEARSFSGIAGADCLCSACVSSCPVEAKLYRGGLLATHAWCCPVASCAPFARRCAAASCGSGLVCVRLLAIQGSLLPTTYHGSWATTWTKPVREADPTVLTRMTIGVQHMVTLTTPVTWAPMT